MSRKWIAGLIVLAALGGTTVAASAMLGSGADGRPAYATVTVDLGDARPGAARKLPATTKKPKVVYLQSNAPTTINPADPAAGGIGPNIDVKLTGCSKVIDGGVVPSRFDVYVQGSYVKTASEYHVLIGIDEDNLVDRTPFTIGTNLTCLKGTK